MRTLCAMVAGSPALNHWLICSRACGVLTKSSQSREGPELDGSVVHLKAGDVMVQRGTIHNWVNRGTAPCVLAVVLIDAKPVEAGGKVLNAVG